MNSKSIFEPYMNIVLYSMFNNGDDFSSIKRLMRDVIDVASTIQRLISLVGV